jgi:serine/threonine-protein kinase
MEGDARIGTVLGGKYRIVRKLGEGGMGAVYAGVQEPLGRKVAVKVLLPVLARDATLVGRFQREAELAASLGHPNIVQVTDFGVDEGSAFLVMDLLDGESLGSLLERETTLAPSRVRFVAAQVLSALEAAHARGVVHRDLKPDNVYLTSVSGVADLVKLLDFGIARLTEGDGDQKMTATGQVLGTPAYMSPEQARGKPVDARSDLYALGVVMYEALSGRMPVNGSNYHELMFAIVGEMPTPLAQLVPDLDPALVAVVERAMAKDPNARYASAAEMRAALDALGPLQASSPARVPSMPPTRDASAVAMAATITPEAMTALPSTATPVVSSAPTAVSRSPSRGPSSGASSAANVTPAAVPAVLSAPPPARRGALPWVAGLLALAAIGGGLVFWLRGAGSEEVALASAPDESDAVVSDATSAVEARIEAAAEARAQEIAERVLRETAERMAEATGMGAEPSGEPSVGNTSEPSRLGAPDSVVAAEQAAREAAERAANAPTADMQAREATSMRREPSAPGTRMVRCGDTMREHAIVRPGDSVRVTFRQTNNVVSMDTYRAITNGWTPQLTSCFVGHPPVGGIFTIEVDASGRVTKLRHNPFCDTPPALLSCLERFLEGSSVGNDTGAPGEMRFDINHAAASRD